MLTGWDKRRSLAREGGGSGMPSILLLEACLDDGGVLGLLARPVFILVSLSTLSVLVEGSVRAGVVGPESASGGLSVLILSLSLSDSSVASVSVSRSRMEVLYRRLSGNVKDEEVRGLWRLSAPIRAGASRLGLLNRRMKGEGSSLALGFSEGGGGGDGKATEEEAVEKLEVEVSPCACECEGLGRKANSEEDAGKEGRRGDMVHE